MIETSKGAVECAVFGEGPAVLALHGAMGGYDQSLLLARAALGTSGFRVIAVSRPGYLGTKLALGTAPEEQADVYAALLDSLGVSQTAVVAISGGGQSALQFALRHPDRCRALVMISACSAPITVKLPLRFQMIKLMARMPAFTAAMSRKAAKDPESSARRSIPDPALRARTLSDPEAGPMMLELQLSTFDRLPMRMPGTLNDIEQARRPFDYPLERISVPLLAIYGTEDEAVPYEQGRGLARRVPGAELFTIDGGRHVSLFTHLHEIRARVARFFT